MLRYFLRSLSCTFVVAASFGQGFEEERRPRIDGDEQMAFADLDGDGDLDYLRGTPFLRGLLWSENDGSGAFGPGRMLAPVDGPSAGVLRTIVCGDLDGDGRGDVLEARDGSANGSIGWYPQVGPGSFGMLVPISTFAEGLEGAQLADLDLDADLDILVRLRDGAIVWAPNLGMGAGGTTTFGTPQQISAVGTRVGAMLPIDLDSDGDLDLATVTLGASRVVTYENLGAGSFGPQVQLPHIGLVARSLGGADVDLDGDADLMVVFGSSRRIAWLENDGTGLFGSARTVGQATVAASGLQAGDFDGDGDVDVLFGCTGVGCGVRWIEGLGPATFAPPEVLFPGLQVPLSERIGAADINGNGRLDLWVDAGSTRWIETVGPPSTWDARELSLAGPQRGGIATIDFDADGDLDLARTGFGGADIAVNDGNGTFSETVSFGATVTTTTHPVAVDFDGDGDTDLVTARVIGGDRVAFHENLGNLQFAPERSMVVPPAFTARVIDFGDMEGDGDTDLYLSSNFDGYWLQNDGQGSFTVGPAGPRLAYGVNSGDVDGDGSTEFVDASSGASGCTVRMLRTLPSGVLGATPLMVLPTSACFSGMHPALVDVTGNGQLDVVLFDSTSATIGVLAGLGGGAFGTFRSIAVPPDAPVAFDLLDVDLDGLMDLLTRSDEELWWYPGLANGTFGIPVRVSHIMGAGETDRHLLCDLDGDGDADIIKETEFGAVLQSGTARIGVRTCRASTPNSQGALGSISATGSDLVLDNDLTLLGEGLPPGQFGMFLVGTDRGLVVAPGGSQGTLCLGGAIGRFNRAMEIRLIDGAGTTSLVADLTDVPTASGSSALLPGDTLVFQLWYRDVNPGTTANLTGALEIAFR